MKLSIVIGFVWMQTVIATAFTLAWLGYINAAAWTVVMGAVVHGVASRIVAVISEAT